MEPKYDLSKEFWPSGIPTERAPVFDKVYPEHCSTNHSPICPFFFLKSETTIVCRLDWTTIEGEYANTHYSYLQVPLYKHNGYCVELSELLREKFNESERSWNE